MTSPLRRAGQALSIVGLVVGGATGIAMTIPVHLTGVAWLVAVGLTKLTLAASLGLIGGGAVMQRLGRQAEERKQLEAPHDP